MHKTIEGVVDENGTIRLLEKFTLTKHQRVLVTVFEEDEEFVGGVPVTALLAEKSLAEYWDRPEEDEAWKDFQPKAK
jgi:hypothetical protein